jgi:formylglycine-generating enzyme required for sulfatase activity
MIGNLWEWTSDWWQAGRGWVDSDGVSADSGAGGWAGSLPAAALRGGYWGTGTWAGAFTLAVYIAPSYSSDNLGFRCVVR